MSISTLKISKPNPEVYLDTSNTSTVNTDLWCCVGGAMNFTSLNFTGGVWVGAERSLIASPYFDYFDALGFRGYQFSEGTKCDYQQYMIGETAVSGGTGSGYNCAGDTICTVGAPAGGVCCVSWTKDWFNAFIEFTSALGNSRVDLLVNLQQPAPDWINQLDWALLHAHNSGVDVGHVILGLEQVTGSNDNYWLGSTPTTEKEYYQKAQNYVDKINTNLATWKAAYPNISWAVDFQRPEMQAAQLLRTKTWNGKVIELDVDAVRYYINHNDQDWTFGADFNDNLDEVNRVFSDNGGTGSVLQNLKELSIMAAHKDICIAQWGWQNFEESVVSDTALQDIAIGKLVRLMLRYNHSTNNRICSAFYETGKALVSNSNVRSLAYYAMKACAPLFVGSPEYIPIRVTTPGIQAVAVRESGTYKILFINETTSDVTYSSVTVDNTRYVSSDRYSTFSSALSSTTQTEQIATGESGILVRKCGLTLITLI